MPDPEITARKFTAIQQFNRLPCPWCQREALSTSDEDMIVGHVDPADDKLCPELARRERERTALVARLEELREAFQTATPEREILPVDARTLAEKAKSIFDAMDAAGAAYRPDPPPVFSTRARAQAYEQHLRDVNTAGWSDLIHGSVRRMADEHVRKLDQMLEVMPVGYRLCVHDAEWPTAPDDQDYVRESTIRMRVRQTVHMLGPDDTCLVTYRRTVYGPKR